MAYQLPEVDSARLGYLSVPNRHDIFVAYTPENTEMVRSLDGAIHDIGLKPWIGLLQDLLNPNPDRIFHIGIQESDALILLLENDGTIPTDLEDELEQALDLNRLIILISQTPIQIQKIKTDHLSHLAELSCHQLSISQLAEAIFHILVYARLVARATEWQEQEKTTTKLLSSDDLKAAEEQVSWIKKHPEFGLTIEPLQADFLQASQQENTHGAPPSIFISYSRRDIAFVNHLVQSLKEEGFIVWLDRENIPVATNWQDEVKKGIASAHTFIFVISPNSVKSEHCAWELKLAEQLGTRIIPICCDNSYGQDSLNNLNLGSINYVDFQKIGFIQALDQLVEAIKTDLKDAETYNELSRRAYDWNYGNQRKEYLLSRADCKRLEKWLHNRNVVPSKFSCLSEVKELSKQYLIESRNHLNRQRKNLFLASTMLGTLIFFLSGVAVKSDLGEIDALVGSLEQKQGLEGLVTALRASEKLEGNLLSPEKLRLEAITALHKELLGVHELNSFRGHERGVFDVAFSPKGQYLVSGGEDKTVRVWDFLGNELAVSQHHDDRVVAIEFSPEGDFFLSASYDGKVNLWSCQPDFLIKHLKDYVPPEQYKSDTSALDCQFVRTLTVENSNAGIVRLSMSQDGQHIAAASLDKTVYLWTRGDDLYQQQQGFSHTVVPWGLDFSADSSMLVSADQSGEVLVRAIGRDQVIAKQNIGRFVTDVRFSPDGRWIAIGGENGLLKLWDFQKNKLVDLPGHNAGFVRVMFSPSDNTLASADTLGNMYLWKSNILEAALQPDSKKKLVPLTLKGHQDGISRIRFSPDGRYLASTSLDDTIRLWLTTEDHAENDSQSPAAPESYAVLEGHRDEVLNVSFSPLNGGDQSSTYLASTSKDGTIRLWRTQTGIQPLDHENRLFDIDFHPQQDVLATGGVNSISLWDLSDYTRRQIQYQKPGIGKPDDLNIVTVDYSPNGEFLLAGDSKGEIRLWQPDISVDRGYYARKRKSHKNLVEKVFVDGVFVARFSSDGTFIASGGADGKVKFWDVSKDMRLLGAEAFINSNDASCAVVSLDFSADGHQLVVASAVNQLQASQDPDKASNCSIKVYRIKIDPRSKRIELDESVVVGESGILSQLQTISERFAPNNHLLPASKTSSSGALTVDFHPQANRFASGGEDGFIRVWSTRGKLLKILEGHTDAINRVDYSEDGKILISSSKDGTIKFWNPQTGKMLSSLEEHERQVSKVMFNPSNPTMFASSGFDGRALIWEIPEGFDRRTLDLLATKGCETARFYLANENNTMNWLQFLSLLPLPLEAWQRVLGQSPDESDSKPPMPTRNYCPSKLKE